jgi:hypothetical protein
MKPERFKEQNTTMAKNQYPYLPLPAFKDEDGAITSCWSLNIRERIKLFFTGRIWLTLLTFNKPLQPQILRVDYPFIINKEQNKHESSKHSNRSIRTCCR